MVALNLLRERKGCFDLVLSDVHMPDMDGFRLLELVGLEMDLPVIMMSADGRTNLVMKGIKHGACDYLIKPIRDEELKNIWQHVVRKKWNGIKDHEGSGAMEDNDRSKKRVADDADCACSVNKGSDEDHEVLKPQKKRRDANDEDESDTENDESTTGKKPRVVWSIELHQQFVCAVNQLGIDKAVPKRILELMNVPGLTRENVASHLQKFRLYLKRLSGVAQQQGGLTTSYSGLVDHNFKLPSLGRFDIQALAASGQLPPQTLAALHEFLSRTAGSLVLPAMDQPTSLHPSLHGPKPNPLEPNGAYCQPLIRCSSNVAKQISQLFISNKDVHSEFVAWSGKNPADVAHSGNLVGNNNVSISFVQQQKQQHWLDQQQKQYGITEPSCLTNVQPSCLIVPSQSSSIFQGGNNLSSVYKNSSFRNPALEHKSHVNYSSSGSQSVQCKPVSVTSESSRSRNLQDNACQSVSSLPSTFEAVSQVPNMQRVLVQASTKNPVYVSQNPKIPTRFAVEEHELTTNTMGQAKAYANDSDGIGDSKIQVNVPASTGSVSI